MPNLPAVRAAATALLLFCANSIAHAVDIERTGGPYVPTPQTVVEAMLEFAKVGPKDFVVDLGSGDGRIVLTAAERYQARGFGVDIDPELVEQSNAEAKKRGLADRVSFRREDVLQAKIDEATVVTLYLLPGMMQQLQAKFARELRPGTRIVSHDFAFGEWRADREVAVDVPEKYGTPGQWKSTLYFWVVPARVGGTWQLNVPDLPEQPLTLALEQQFQTLQGNATGGGRRSPVVGGRMEGSRIAFALRLPSGTFEFRGALESDRMRGEVLHGGRAHGWTAVRTGAPAQ